MYVFHVEVPKKCCLFFPKKFVKLERSTYDKLIGFMNRSLVVVHVPHAVV